MNKIATKTITSPEVAKIVDVRHCNLSKGSLPKYVKWSFEIILNNKERAKEIYYLLLGFSGSERRCSI